MYIYFYLFFFFSCKNLKQIYEIYGKYIISYKKSILIKNIAFIYMDKFYFFS